MAIDIDLPPELLQLGDALPEQEIEIHGVRHAMPAARARISSMPPAK
jgi:hypothetical protein